MTVHNRQNITIRKVTFQTFHAVKNKSYDTNIHMKPTVPSVFFIHNVEKFNTEFSIFNICEAKTSKG